MKTLAFRHCEQKGYDMDALFPQTSGDNLAKRALSNLEKAHPLEERLKN